MMCAALGVLLLACDSRVAPQREWQATDHAQPTQVDPDRVPSPGEPEQGGVGRAASALWNVTCAGCHGRDGRGQGISKPPGSVVPDFTVAAFQKQRSDDQLLQVIRDGRGLMPGFGKQLNDQGVSAMVTHVRSFLAAK